MAAAAPKIKDKLVSLRKARSKLYNAIVRHDDKQIGEIIGQVQSLGGDLNKPWAKSNGDAIDDARHPVVLAAYAHNLKAIRLLLNTNKIDLSYENAAGTPILVSVCRTGDEQAVAMLLRKGVPVNIQSDCDIQPLHEAFFASMKFNYSVVFHSRCKTPAIKQALIDWYLVKDKPAPVEEELELVWGGNMPLAALLLKYGADPAAEDSAGISPLKAVRNPNCVLENYETRCVVELDGSVDYVSKEGEGENTLLVFRVNLKDRALEKNLVVKLKVDYNMEFPEDAAIRTDRVITDIWTGKKVTTMKGLIEAFALKDKSALHAPDALLEIKQRMEEVKQKAEAAHGSAFAAAAQAAAAHAHVVEVKLQHEQVALRVDVVALQVGVIHDQHVEVWEKHQADEAYKARLEAIKKDKSSAVYVFFDTIAKELDKAFLNFKLLLSDPTGKSQKWNAASEAINTIAGFAPFPFSTAGHITGFLVKKYGDHQHGQRRDRVLDLLERDHGPMCDHLALILTEHYGKQLEGIMNKLSAEMEPEEVKDKIKELAKNAVGAMLAVMCNDRKPIDSRDSAPEIEHQLVETVKESAFFQQKLLEATQKLSLAARAWGAIKPVDMAASAAPKPSLSPALAAPSPSVYPDSSPPLSSPAPFVPAFAGAPAAGAAMPPSHSRSPLPGRPPGSPLGPQLPPGPRPVAGSAAPKPVILSGPPAGRSQSPPSRGAVQKPGVLARFLSPRPGSKAGAAV